MERKACSSKEKLEILKKFDALPPGLSQGQAAEKLGVNRTSWNKLLKERGTLETLDVTTRKRKRSGKAPEIEAALFKWISEVCSRKNPLSGPLLKEKTEDLPHKLGVEDFKANEGWFY